MTAEPAVPGRPLLGLAGSRSFSLGRPTLRALLVVPIPEEGGLESSAGKKAVMADDFGFFSSSESGAAEAADEDPAAAFLAQQENEIAGIENDEGISCAEGAARGSQEAAGEPRGERAGNGGGGRGGRLLHRGDPHVACPGTALRDRGGGGRRKILRIVPREAAAISLNLPKKASKNGGAVC